MQQQNLLQIHRRTLYDYLSRQGRMGQANAPAEVTYGIDNSRKEIRRIKNILRAWGEYIEDLPDDEEARTSTAPRIKDVDIAIVVVAMTQSEATGLFSVLSDQTTSINSHNFNEIKL